MTWPGLPVAAPPPPEVEILSAAVDSTGRPPETLDYPADRLAVTTGGRPLARNSTFAVAVITSSTGWSNGRLSSDVATLVRRPDLAVAVDGEVDRNPGDPIHPATVSTGYTFRASVLGELLEGRSRSDEVEPAEYAVARVAWQAVAGPSSDVGEGAPRADAG